MATTPTTSTVTLSGRLALTLDNGAYIDLGEVEVPISVNVGHPLRPPFGYAPGVRGIRPAAAETEEDPDVEPDHDRDAPPTDTDGGVRLNPAPVEDARAYAKARQAGETPAVARAAVRADADISAAVARTIQANAIRAYVDRTVREGNRHRGDAR